MVKGLLLETQKLGSGEGAAQTLGLEKLAEGGPFEKIFGNL